ncbi:MAG: SAM-dependent methyltransferase [Verrucomicrobiales bacterium]|nr:SAM-dependent methyltransferase [Verrucomicrobiales bacterium]
MYNPECRFSLASGTGLWTSEHLRSTQRVTCLDAAGEMHDVNRGKNGTDRVHYRLEDLFEREPSGEYDLVSTTFWLSHVPTDRLDEFLRDVARSISEGGHFFLVDSQIARTSRARDHEEPGENFGSSRRKFNDGREFDIVKIFHDPDDLTERMANAGLRADVQTSENFFIYGMADLT